MTGPDPELILLHIGRSLYGETYPEAYRKILMASVLSGASAAELHRTLTEDYAGFAGCQNTVNNWLVANRKWMGFKGKSRKEVREEMPEWIAANGKPTVDDIRAGWVPLKHRPQVAGTIPAPTPTTNSSPAPVPAPINAPVNAPEPAPSKPTTTQALAPVNAPVSAEEKTEEKTESKTALGKPRGIQFPTLPPEAFIPEPPPPMVFPDIEPPDDPLPERGALLEERRRKKAQKLGGTK